LSAPNSGDTSVKNSALLSLLLCFAGFCGAEDAIQNQKPLADVKKEIVDGKAVIVDVREKNEWDAGHVKDATSIPLSTLKSGNGDLSALKKDKAIYTYCASGKRSLTAATLLNEKGYHATSLKEGFDALSKNGFEASK
jgi:phage shock protein E